MSYISNLGQSQQTSMVTTTQVMYRQPAYAPYAPVYYAPGVAFARRADGIPGQPYAARISSAEIEKEVYKDLPKETKEEQAVTGTEPQKVLKLESGLEVPAYIIQRDLARKRAEVRKAEMVANVPLPKFHKIGIFAAQQPAKAALYAVVLGYAAGYLAYSLNH